MDESSALSKGLAWGSLCLKNWSRQRWVKRCWLHLHRPLGCIDMQV